MELIFNLQSESKLSVSQDEGAVKLAIAQKIETIPYPLSYHCQVSNPSILHLIQLLQAETQTPKLMNQKVISSIVYVLATHLLQQWQNEQGLN